MSEILVSGYRPLNGEIQLQGSKNGVLPMLAAALLQRGTMYFTNVPTIQDVTCMVGILESLGCRCERSKRTLMVDASVVSGSEIPREYVGQMRSSILLMGPLLGRQREVTSWQPGGCSIGKRPVDLHYMAFQRLGAVITEEDDGKAVGVCPEGLKGCEIRFPFPSVGATENAVLAAVLAEGETLLFGAAREPEIGDLCALLNRMGANIRFDGSGTIKICGVKALHGTEQEIPGDRIVAGTYVAAVLACGGDVRLNGVPTADMTAPLAAFERSGAVLTREGEPGGLSIGRGGAKNAVLRVRMQERALPQDLITLPYPGFPTDLQSVMLAVLSGASGVSHVTETIFEGRFGAVSQLWRMGALIDLEGNCARIQGRARLHGTEVTAGDLRGGAALLIAALAAEGETRIRDCIHIERGYEDPCRDLKALGGEISWAK